MVAYKLVNWPSFFWSLITVTALRVHIFINLSNRVDVLSLLWYLTVIWTVAWIKIWVYVFTKLATFSFLLGHVFFNLSGDDFSCRICHYWYSDPWFIADNWGVFFLPSWETDRANVQDATLTTVINYVSQVWWMGRHCGWFLYWWHSRYIRKCPSHMRSLSSLRLLLLRVATNRRRMVISWIKCNQSQVDFFPLLDIPDLLQQLSIKTEQCNLVMVKILQNGQQSSYKVLPFIFVVLFLI